MNRLADVFYLVGNSDGTYPSEFDLRKGSEKEMELYEKLRGALNDEQRATLDELYEAVVHVQGMQEHLLVQKAVALGIQITSEAFLLETGDINV